MYLILVQALDLLKSLTGLFPFCWANGRLIRLDLFNSLSTSVVTVEIVSDLQCWLHLLWWKSVHLIYSENGVASVVNFLIITQFTLCAIFWSFSILICIWFWFDTCIPLASTVYIFVYIPCVPSEGGCLRPLFRASVRGIWSWFRHRSEGKTSRFLALWNR